MDEDVSLTITLTAGTIEIANDVDEGKLRLLEDVEYQVVRQRKSRV